MGDEVREEGRVSSVLSGNDLGMVTSFEVKYACLYAHTSCTYKQTHRSSQGWNFVAEHFLSRDRGASCIAIAIAVAQFPLVGNTKPLTGGEPLGTTGDIVVRVGYSVLYHLHALLQG
jgi:hypothetical protein